MSTAFGSLDIHFTYTPSGSLSILLQTNIQARQAHSKLATLGLATVNVRIGSKTVSGSLSITTAVEAGGQVLDKADYRAEAASMSNVEMRIFFRDNHLSVYANRKWIYTYSFDEVGYPEAITASLKAVGAGATLTNLRRTELADAREAVYVDYEATSENAIQTVIQQRPIEIFPEVQDAIAFTYRVVKDTVAMTHVHNVTETETVNSQTSSDGLVYYADVGVSVDVQSAARFGLITRLYRLSELNTGAVQATRSIQRKARERFTGYQATGRLHPGVEVGDRLQIAGLLSGTGRAYSADIIAEDIRISGREGEYSMTVSGRKHE